MVTSLPPFFQALTAQGYLASGGAVWASDGFFAVTSSIADLLIGRGIGSVLGAGGHVLPCDKFFDDWYLYALPHGAAYVYGLFKLREQEYDAENGIEADGDTPGVTISFIALEPDALWNCLSDPTPSNQRTLEEELHRVVASRGQRHHPAIKDYFKRAEAQGPYLVAELYVRKIASLAQNGSIPVPKPYAALCRSCWGGRLPAFLAANNGAAGRTVCGGGKIYIQDPAELSVHEQLAILATHTANVSFHSFAAEVRFHALFLTWFARLPIPFVGRSLYDSAIRADMSLDKSALLMPAPYYRSNSRMVKKQRKFHGDNGSHTDHPARR